MTKTESVPEERDPEIKTPGMERVLEVIVPRATAALMSEHPTEPVLLIAPTGTGKSYVRDRIIKAAGLEYDSVFLNCATLTESLVESELFGHVAGAFTGAMRDYDGFLGQDKKLFVLDEVNSLPKPLQAKLLTLLDDGKYRRIGSNTEKTFRGKVLAISNSKLNELKLRNDFLYRFLVLTIPPLHRRRIDILVFLRALCPGMLWKRADLLRLLCYHWPGNLRQLTQFAKIVRRNPPPTEPEWRFNEGVLQWYDHPFGGCGLFPGIPESRKISSLLDIIYPLASDIERLSPLIWPSGWSDVADLGAIEQLEIGDYIAYGLRLKHRERKIQFWQDDWETWCAIFDQSFEDKNDILTKIFERQVLNDPHPQEAEFLLETDDANLLLDVRRRVGRRLDRWEKGGYDPSVQEEAQTQQVKGQPQQAALGTKPLNFELMYEEMTPEAFKNGWIQHKIDTNQSAAEVARKFGLSPKTVAAWFREYKKIQDSLGSIESHNDSK